MNIPVQAVHGPGRDIVRIKARYGDLKSGLELGLLYPKGMDERVGVPAEALICPSTVVVRISICFCLRINAGLCCRLIR